MPEYLCEHCLCGKKEHCGDKRFPKVTKCEDFIHEDSIHFQPKGTKPGLEARHFMTTTQDMIARGEIEQFDKDHSRELINQLDVVKESRRKERERVKRKQRINLLGGLVLLIFLALVVIGFITLIFLAWGPR